MTQVIALVSAKGGCGKTATARGIAGFLVGEGLRVGVVDADPNRAFARWHELGGGHGIELRTADDADALFDAVDELVATCDVVLIDTAGQAQQLAFHAVGAANLALVSVTPDEAAVRLATSTASMVAQVSRTARREIPVRAVLTGFKPRSDVSAHTRAEMDRLGLTVVAEVPHRVEWSEATYTGDVLHGPAAVDAQTVVTALRDEWFLPDRAPA